MTLWQPEPLVRLRRRRTDVASELASIDERREGARRGVAELDTKHEQKQSELKALDGEIKELEKKV